jgi:hypothetical protein
MTSGMLKIAVMPRPYHLSFLFPALVGYPCATPARREKSNTLAALLSFVGEHLCLTGAAFAGGFLHDETRAQVRDPPIGSEDFLHAIMRDPGYFCKEATA